MHRQMFFLACLLVAIAGTVEASPPPRKLLVDAAPTGLVDAVGDFFGSHVNSGLKAGKKVVETVQHQVKKGVAADLKVGEAITKSAGKAINGAQKALVIGVGEKINDLTSIVSAPFTGSMKLVDPKHSAASKELQKAIKAVDQGKQDVSRAIEKAVDKKQHAVSKATKDISRTLDQNYRANSKAHKEVSRAIQKAITGGRK